MNLPWAHVTAGEVRVTRGPKLLVTVLGSCVAVTMFAREAGLAAMCHVALPHPPGCAPAGEQDPERFRYASRAVPEMLGVYRRAGVAPADIEVKLFGGGNVLGAAGASIGASNLAAVRSLLQAARVTVKAESTGGRHGRKIMFNTATGEVLHRKLAERAP